MLSQDTLIRIKTANAMLAWQFTVYIGFLLSPFMHYIIGGMKFWHMLLPVTIIVLIPFVITVWKSARHVFSIMLIAFVISSIDIGLFSSMVKGGQFIFSFTILLTTIYACKRYSLYYNKKFISLYKFIYKVVWFFLIYQLITRISIPSIDLSAYQSYRVLGSYFPQLSSLFYEPRGLAQFFLVSIFINSLFPNKYSRRTVVISCLGVLLTGSLGGVIAASIFLVSYHFRFLRIFFTLRVGKMLPFFIFLISFFALLLSSTPAASALKNRLEVLFSKVSEVEYMIILENAYKLNHKDYYSQYSKEFEKIYGFSGGSESVSVLSEISYLYLVLKTSPVFGFGLASQDRELSLNAVVDFVSRFGFFGLLVFLIFIKENTYILRKRYLSTVVFFLLFSAIDGALSKPQYWFLLSVIVVHADTYFKTINREKQLVVSNSIAGRHMVAAVNRS